MNFFGGGEIVKERARLDGGSQRARGVSFMDDFTPVSLDARSLAGTVGGRQGEKRDGCNGGKRLSAKTHRLDLEKIFSVPDLRGRMALERKTGVGCIHSRAIVGDPNEAKAPSCHLDE